MATRRFRELLGEWKAGEGPLYQRLADTLREAIERGELAMGTRLPAQRQLAEMLGVSRTTAVLAYDRLVQEGWLESREGSGTTIRRGPTRALAIREGAAAVIGSRNEVFRGLVVHTGADIEFHGAHFEGMPEVFDGLWKECRDDLAKLLEGHGYVPFGLPPLREAIASHLERSGLPAETREDVVLACTEAATNAIEHAYIGRRGDVLIEAESEAGTLQVSVVDHGRWRHPRPDDSRGRGLELVRAVIGDIDVERGEGGTTVRMRVGIP